MDITVFDQVCVGFILAMIVAFLISELRSMDKTDIHSPIADLLKERNRILSEFDKRHEFKYLLEQENILRHTNPKIDSICNLVKQQPIVEARKENKLIFQIGKNVTIEECSDLSFTGKRFFLTLNNNNISDQFSKKDFNFLVLFIYKKMMENFINKMEKLA